MKYKENTQEKFKRLAISRTNVIIKNIRSLAKLSNSRIYSYDKNDIDKIYKAIQNDLKISRAMFDKNLNSKKFEL
tara:strand:+ start:241 stop:465 length:225 start_codon:yes stop_codon:yes gene_type:complete